MSECGTFADSYSDTNLLFTTSNNNAILMGANSAVTCYSYSTRDKMEERQQAIRLYTTWCEPGGNCQTSATDTTRAVMVKVGTETVTNSTTLQLHPYHIEAKGVLHLQWNNEGHLIASIADLRSTLTGTEGDIGRVFKAYLYSGPISFSLAVTLNPITAPANDSSSWRHCLGGWTSSYQNCALAHCGGTLYYWNKWDGTPGTPWVNNGTTNNPVRSNTGLNWDLGTIEQLGDITKLQVYVYARAFRGYCGSQTAANYTTAQAGIDIPNISICPPELETIEMTRDICEYTVGAKARVKIPQLGTTGVNLYAQYKASTSTNLQDWSGATTVQINDVAENSTVEIDLGQSLVPNARYCFRLWLGKDGLSSKEVVSCGHDTLALPDPQWNVPEWTTAECDLLKEGEFVPELDAEKVKELQC